MEERLIIQVVGQVMVYDASAKQWHPAGTSSGLSTVRLIQSLPNNTFRIHGQKINDLKEVVLDSQITREVKYNRANEAFIQWHDSQAFWGLNFRRGSPDAESFFASVVQVLRVLNQNANHQQQSNMPPEILANQHQAQPSQQQQAQPQQSAAIIQRSMQQQQQILQQHQAPQQPMLHQQQPQLLNQQQPQSQMLGQVPSAQLIQQQQPNQQQLLQQQQLHQHFMQQQQHQHQHQQQQQPQQQQPQVPAPPQTNHNTINHYQSQQSQHQSPPQQQPPPQQHPQQQPQLQQHHVQQQSQQQQQIAPVSAVPIPPPPPPPPAPPAIMNNCRINGTSTISSEGSDNNALSTANLINNNNSQHLPITNNVNSGLESNVNNRNGGSPNQAVSLANQLAKCHLRKVNLSRSDSDKESECNNNHISNAKSTRAASLACVPDLMSDLKGKLASRREKIEHQQGDGQSMSNSITNGGGNTIPNTNGIGGDKANESWLADLIRKEISKEITKMKAEIIDAIKTELRQR